MPVWQVILMVLGAAYCGFAYGLVWRALRGRWDGAGVCARVLAPALFAWFLWDWCRGRL